MHIFCPKECTLNGFGPKLYSSSHLELVAIGKETSRLRWVAVPVFHYMGGKDAGKDQLLHWASSTIITGLCYPHRKILKHCGASSLISTRVSFPFLSVWCMWDLGSNMHWETHRQAPAATAGEVDMAGTGTRACFWGGELHQWGPSLQMERMTVSKVLFFSLLSSWALLGS